MPRTRRHRLLAAAGVAALVLTGFAFAAPAQAADGDVKLNEVRSNPNPDLVELFNTGSAPVDLTGWKVADSDHAPVAFAPAGTSIAAGGYFSFDPDTLAGGFGLGAADSVTISNAGGATIDTLSWTAHRTPSFGRCPAGTGAFVVNATSTPGAANDCPAPDPTAVTINEISSNPNDFVELYNGGSAAIDINGWTFADSDHAPIAITAVSTVIPAGGYYSFDPNTLPGGFGLGSADAATVRAGSTVVDTYSWTSHRIPSFGRCPAGTGALVANTTTTPGSANACPVPSTAVKINEFSSNNPDFVELINTGTTTVDLSGWVLKDNSDSNSYTFPAGSSIAPATIKGLSGEGVEFGFGLGNGDAVRLYAPGVTDPVDSYTYPAHPPAGKSYGRCPDGSGAFVITNAATKGAANDCSTAPVVPDVVVNEVESNGDQVADWVELKNRGASPADVSGWKIVDGDDAHLATPVVVPANTVIPAGGYYALYTEIAQSPGFGLGVGDSVRLFLANGTTLVDSTTWGAHAPTTWGRCPDGTGAFGNTTTSTRGLANACSPVRINEIESSGGTPGDWIELKNISTAAVDVSGWSVKDAGETPYTIPAGTSIAANGYLVLEEAQLPFGLGGADAVRLFDDGGALIEQYTWATAATQTYGRCKDGVGQIVDTKAPSKGAVNICPGLETQPWPGPQTVGTADLVGTFIQDLSGLVFDPTDPDELWAAQNKKGTLFKLERDANDQWVPAAGWPRDPKFANGAGSPDSEGITIGPDGFVYLTTERDNDASGVSRNTVLRFDPAAPAGATIVPTTEWNLTPLLPAVGANLGIEGIAFVPDSYLVGNGFRDQSTNAAYNPATYPLHGSGLFFVAYENDGKVYAFALDSDGTAHRVATIDSGFPNLADVNFDPERQRVWAVTDDTHDGKYSLLKVGETGDFTVDVAYERPAAMPNLNNEGMAIAGQSACVNGTKEVLWADDGDTDGHSIRRGAITCTELPKPQEVTFTTAAPVGAVVGDTYAPAATGGASGNPVEISIDPASAGVCALFANVVTLIGAGECTLNADQAAAPGYLAGHASQSFTVAKAPVVVRTKASSGLVTLLTLRINYATTVTSAVTGLPVAGVPVTTKLDGYKAGSGCTAVTNAQGVATCTAGPINIALGIRFTATAAETANHLGGTGSAVNGLL